MTVIDPLPIVCAALLGIAAAAVGEPAPSGLDPQCPKPAAESSKAIAFLGVVTTPPPRIMIEQLGLKAGEGLVVTALAPGGPAEKAGLEVNDIITGVGDARIQASKDLTDAIRARSPGDIVRLKIIRKGAPSHLDTTLGARPLEFPDALQIHRAIHQILESRGAAPDDVKALELAIKDAASAMEIPVGSSIRLIDERGSVEMKTADGKKDVSVRDKNEKIIWSGPWNTQAEKNAVPPEVRKRFMELDIETLFESSRIRLRLPGTKTPSDTNPEKTRKP